MKDLTKTLVGLVDTRSVVGDEGRLCTAIAERLLPTWGLEGVKRIGNSLVVGRRTGRPLLSLYGHIDTVPEQGQGDARRREDLLQTLATQWSSLGTPGASVSAGAASASPAAVASAANTRAISSTSPNPLK